MDSAKSLNLGLRWTARITGGLLIAFVLLHVATEGLPKVEGISLEEAFLWGGFITCFLGNALLWKWELTGGVIAISGVSLFFAANYALSGKLPLGWAMMLLVLPGFLSITCWFLEPTRTRRLN